MPTLWPAGPWRFEAAVTITECDEQSVTNWLQFAQIADVTWIEGGDHLAFWLSPHAPAAQASGRAFLNHHMKSGTPTGGR